MIGRRSLTAVCAVLLLASASACATTTPRPSETGTPAIPQPAPTSTAAPVAPTGETRVIAEGLDSPWSLLPLGASTLISSRDTGEIIELASDGTLHPITTVPGVVHGGEGGLLGLAASERGERRWVYAYFTGESDNRVIRMPLGGAPGAHTLGDAEVIVEGLPRASNHNGGRIAFGPDGMLYITAGDAGNRDGAQSIDYLGGKILRVTATGDIPGDNPFDGSPVWSYGHRNPQGIAWGSDGRMWASEFGQDTWDELNLIEPGNDYGWPIVEGQAGNPDFVDPLAQWSTDEASPSGLAIIDDTIFMAALRGERLWGILDGVHLPDGSHGLEGRPSATPYFTGEFGRIRDVAPGPSGTLWMITSNTDGRGVPAANDDRLIEVTLAPLVEG